VPLKSTQRYLDALLEGNPEGAWAAITTLRADGASVSEIYIKLLTPAMARIGELWSKGRINVAQQKLATEITFEQMDKLRALGAANRKSPHRVLVCCVEGELHATGARMVADLFRLEGWTVDFLGPDVPTQSIVAMVTNRRPEILALSVTMKQNLRHVRALMAALGKLPEPPKVLIGGQATTTLTRWKVRDLDFKVAPNLIDGLKLALSALRSAPPKSDLAQYLRDIGLRVRELRTKAGHTQARLAQLAGLNRAYIVSVEQGKQNISMGVIVKIANALGVPLEQLLMT
jgi:methanogenic corrinoid protein MtbC1/DNA-binding XRE family transcriptional regulator